jgi:hypothetical protein
MEVKEVPNPVGQVIQNNYIDMFVDSMKAVWDSMKTTVSWWKFWATRSLTPVTDFLLKCLDDLIAYVDQIEGASGADKKATVLAAIGKIYDYIIKEAMPIWLKPFSALVRDYVINVLISHAIDWIITKYRHGDFKPKPSDQLEAQWVMLYGQMVGLPKFNKK